MGGFPEQVIVTDQEVDLLQLTEDQKAYYVVLAEKIVRLYANQDRDRVILSLSGPSGSGKSVVGKILEHIITSQDIDFAFYQADLDAFHYPNAYLEQTCDPQKVLLKEVKGRYDTYDMEKLTNCLARFAEGEEVTFPKYSRRLHNPVEEGFVVREKRALLFIVGLWFLRDDAAWRAVRGYSAYNLYLQGPQEKIRENTIERHIRGGRDRAEAERFYNASDASNAEEIQQTSVEPDETIPYFEDIGNLVH